MFNLCQTVTADGVKQDVFNLMNGKRQAFYAYNNELVKQISPFVSLFSLNAALYGSPLN